MTSTSRAPLVVFSAALLVVGGIFLYIGGSAVLERWRYRQQGVQVDAVVTDKALRRASASTGTAYELSYQFTLPDGSSYRQVQRVAVPLWERIEPGASLGVEYVSGTPASARIADDDSDETASALVALGVGASLVLPVLTGWVMLLTRGRVRRAARNGTTPSHAARMIAATSPRSWPLARATLARATLGFWFGGFSLVVGVPWFVVNAALPGYDSWRFARDGLSTQGMVLTKEIRRSGNTRSETLHYEATYRFAVSGDTIEGRDELSLQDWERLIEREPAEVRYRAQDPSSNRLAGRAPWLLQAFFGLLGLVLTVVGSVALVGALRNARRESTRPARE